MTIDGKTAEVVELRKTAPVAVVVFDTGERELWWYGDTEATDTATGSGRGPGEFADSWIETHILGPINSGPMADQLAEQWGIPAETTGNGDSLPVTDIPVRSPSLATQGHETSRQARRWQGVYGWYDRAGLCPRCCAQAAWGHQLGFSNVKPPCLPCSVIVAAFPVTAANGWNQLTEHTAPQYAPKAVA
ncbi:hypothetical protein D3I60_14070 [Brevibacterium permense]|nr:hypothetical protein [Brevibacterium permense]